MACRTDHRRSGFTLVELLIVIAILGILAAIVVPQFSSSTASARTGSVLSTSRAIEGQVTLYKLEHGDQLPDLETASALGRHFEPLMTATMYGTVRRGPYISSMPVNALTTGSEVRNAAGLNAAGVPNPVPGADFIYDYGSGTGSGKIWGTTDNVTGTPLIP